MNFDEQFTNLLKKNLNELKDSFNLKGIPISTLLFEQQVTVFAMHYVNELLLDEELHKTFQNPGEYLTVLAITCFAFGVSVAYEWIYNHDEIKDDVNQEGFIKNYEKFVRKFESEGPAKRLSEIFKELFGEEGDNKSSLAFDIILLNIKMTLSEVYKKEGDSKEKDPKIILALFSSVAEIGANVVYEVVYKREKDNG